MANIRGTHWFRMLQRRAQALAESLSLPYPSECATSAAALHAEAERKLGARFVDMVR